MRISNPDRQFDRYRRSGDPQALARVFDRLAPELLAVARHLVPDAAEAEDVVQATFLAAIEGAAKFDSERSVRPWLMGILSRQAGLARRRLGRTPEPDLLPEKPDDDPAREAQSAELKSAVERALTSVPAPYSQVLSLHLAEEQRPEEIAAKLGRRPGTVRVQLHRGLKLLRRALPAGIASGLTMSMRAPRGLSAIKAEVLREASTLSVAAPAAPIVGGAGGIGVLTMGKAGILGATAVAVAGIAYFAWPGNDTGSESRMREPRLAGRAVPPVDGHDPSRGAQEPAATARGGERPGAPERSALSAGQAAESPTATADLTQEPLREHDLTGRVTDSSTGAAVSEARITLWFPEDSTGERPSLSLRSGSDGRFDAEGAPGVPVSVSVSAAEYAPLHAQPFKTLDLASAPALLELGDLELERGVRVTGRVIDARTGNGVPDVPVFQFMSLAEGLPRHKLGYGWRVGVSSADGRFEVRERLPFTGVHPHDHGFLAAGEAGMGWARLEALQGGEAEHEVRLELERGVALTITVLNDEGQPLPDAWVTVEPLYDPFAFLHAFEPEYWHGSTEELGAPFAGDTGADGRVTLHVPMPRNDEPARVRIEAGQGGPWRSTELVLDPSRDNLVSLGVEEDSFLAILGRVTDEDGRAIGGAEVSAANDEYARTDTEPNGTFELWLEEHETELPVLSAQAEGFGRASVRYDPSEGFPQRGIDIVLRAAAPLAGTVVDPEGNPVPRSHVSISSRSDDGTFAGDTQRQTVDDQGRFRFDHATPGSWLLHVSPPYGDASWAGVESQVVKAGSEGLRVVLSRSEPGVARVEVSVFEAHTGLALDPDLIHLTARAEPGELSIFATHTDLKRVAGGVVLQNMKPGAWRLWVKASRGAAGHVDFDVEPGDDSLELRLELGSAGSIRGRIPGLDGEVGYPGFVSAMLSEANGTPRSDNWADGSEMSAQAQPGADGSFELRHLLPGAYRLHYVGAGVVAYARVEVRSGSVTEIELEPVPSATVHVRGPEPEEKGYIRLKVSALDGLWAEQVHYGQRKEGTFATSFFLPAGTWTWQASFQADGAPRSQPPAEVEGQVSVVAGDVAEVWARLPH